MHVSTIAANTIGCQQLPSAGENTRLLKMSPTRKFTAYTWAIYVKFKWYLKIKEEQIPGLQDCVSVFKRKQKTRKEIFIGHLFYARHLPDTSHPSCHLIRTSKLQKRCHHNHISKMHRFQGWSCCPECDSSVSEVEQRRDIPDIGKVTRSWD